jgi:MSHA pilin protein MshD
MKRSVRGMALIEVVIAIAVIATAAGAVLAASSLGAVQQSRLYVQQQALWVAQAYLDEITGKEFADPDGVNNEVQRNRYDDVTDYAGLLDNGARDAAGQPIAGLATFTVRVAVTPSGAVPGVAASDLRRIEVRVAAAGTEAVLVGFKVRP